MLFGGRDAERHVLAADPREQHNRAADQPDVARRLTDRLLAWRRALP